MIFPRFMSYGVSFRAPQARISLSKVSATRQVGHHWTPSSGTNWNVFSKTHLVRRLGVSHRRGMLYKTDNLKWKIPPASDVQSHYRWRCWDPNLGFVAALCELRIAQKGPINGRRWQERVALPGPSNAAKRAWYAQ